MSMTVLMVAEKPMLATSIGKILSNGQATQRKGWNGACSVSEWLGTFKGQRARFKMTSTCGHVMTTDFPAKFNNWERVDPVELFRAPTEKKEATAKLRMPAYLESEAKGADALVLWLDCDKEGENICFEVIDAVERVMKRPSSGQFRDVVYRAKFSAITDKDIKAAMGNLGKPDENQSLSVDARQELDLRIGCAFTRFQTRYFQGKFGDLDSSLISFGPCQTPTLGFCVERHDAIQSFVPEPYWLVGLFLDDPEGRTLQPEWARGRIFDRDVAQLFLERVKKDGRGALVEEVSQKEASKTRPQALNTVELMRVGSAGMGMSPQHTMAIAEQLYTQGFISYPRTETNEYPANFDLRGTLSQQSGHPEWGGIVSDVLREGMKAPRKGSDAGDHPPITPMRADNGRSLSGDHARIYEFVVKNFVASLMEDAKYNVTTVRFSIGGESFSSQGKVLISPGFTLIMGHQAIAGESLPPLSKGQILPASEVKLLEKMTSPPDYLTESELITLMEKHGIGTDASIPVHINNISQRNYVTVEAGRKLVPTRLGAVLVHGYWKIDGELVLPTMRAEVERQLEKIAKGEADFHQVKNHALEIFRLKFIYFVSAIAPMEGLFEVSFTALSESGKPFSRCGKCRRFMKLIDMRPQRLHCPQCQDSYNLPGGKDGLLKSYGEKKCPLDDFELVFWQGPGGKVSKSFPLCPYCYNHPPFPDMRKGMGCVECSHPACPHAFSSLGVCACLGDCLMTKDGEVAVPGGPRPVRGVLVLDASSGPKWRLACNKCHAVVIFADGASKVKVKDAKCQTCESQIVLIEYKKDKSPLPDEADSVSGCLFCHPDIKPLVNLKHSQGSQAPVLSRGRGRGGRGGGDRGRGGGRGRGTGRGGRR